MNQRFATEGWQPPGSGAPTPDALRAPRNGFRRVFVALASLPIAGMIAHADPTSDALEFFEKRVRPVLAENCYSCHGARAGKLKGNLAVDSREGLLHGGDLGPAIVPGDPDRSLLVKAIRFTDPELQMPPKKGKLSDRQIADLTTWIKGGAPWPDSEGRTTARPANPGKPSDEVTESDRQWWSFQRVHLPPIPDGSGPDPNPNPNPHPVDAFVLEKLRARAIRPNPPAARRDLIRRAYFDLLGLPPSPEAIAEFELDPAPDAWPRLVDSLLARPEYGERWARHWLDLVRFAQSNGYERDGEKPLAWRYRDYVVRALNDDKPYDRFVVEHIAGDQLEPYSPDAVIATGFQRLGVWDDEPDDKRMAEFDELDDILSTTASSFLGLTLGCARCHDHKFDPFPQADYYRLLAYFRNTRLAEAPKYTLDSAQYVPLAEPDVVEAWRSSRDIRLQRWTEQKAVATEKADQDAIAAQIAIVEGERPPWEWALGVRERGSTPPPTHVLVRGNPGTPGPAVEPALPLVFGTAPTRVDAGGSRRRLGFARWVASPDNPLTARVLVNRVWQHHFGRGLVATPSDFGRAGIAPTHPELLDWLAADFMAHGWSVKHLHRTLLRSETYQRSTRNENHEAAARDPGNSLYWRQNLRRLEAEAMRDTFLAIAGQLNPERGGRGFFPRLSGEVLAGQSRPGLDWEISRPSEQNRRSLYIYVRRTMMVPLLETFDYNNTSSSLGERPVTTVAPQSLLLLNDAFMFDQATAFASRVKRETEFSPESRIRHAFRLATGRSPSEPESRLATDFLARQSVAFANLQDRLAFRPEVPLSLSVDYMGKLRPDHFLSGPSRGWTYHRGKWSGAYEGIRTLDRDRGPFALWTGPPLSNVVIQTRLVPHTAFETGGLFFRTRARDDLAVGYECVLEPRDSRLLVRRHDSNVVTLAEARIVPSANGDYPIRIEAIDDRIRVAVDDTSPPLLVVHDPNPILEAGHVGVRAWGAALSLDQLSVQPSAPATGAFADGSRELARSSEVQTAAVGDARSGAPDATSTPRSDSPESASAEPPSPQVEGRGEFVRDPNLASPEDRAFQAFCLMLLNLNEAVYIP